MGALTTRGQSDVSTSDADDNQYLTFLLGGEMYAIGILHIKEIIEYGQLTEVPMMPNFLRGVINLRGRVVPVIDLRSRFGKESTEVTKRTCIVIIDVESNGERQNIGIMVDAVSAVIEIVSSQIEAAPTFGAKIRSDFIEGMGKIDGRFVIILDLTKVLSLDEMVQLADQYSETESQ